MSRLIESKITGALFALCLLSPWIAGAVGVAPTTVENRALRSFPDLGPDKAFDSGTYAELDGFLLDHTPLRQQAASAFNDFFVTTTSRSPSNQLFLTSGETMLLSEDFISPCAVSYSAVDLAASIEKWYAYSDSKTPIVFTIAPDKSAVLYDDLSTAQRSAARCQQQRELEIEMAFADNEAFVDVTNDLRNLVETTSAGNVYYTYDSHWTFEGAAVYAEQLVNRFSPGLFDPNSIVPSDVYEVRADGARRLAWDRRELRPRLISDRTTVDTTLEQLDIGGTRTVRTYTSTGDGPASVVGGTTLVLHDSMMNFAEDLVAPYFESIEFVHWNDLIKADFFGRLRSADRLVIQTVQRNSHQRIAEILLSNQFDESMVSALSPPSSLTLLDAIEARRSALERAIANGQRPTGDSSDLLQPVGHTVFGEWRIIDGVVRNRPGSLAACDVEADQCGLWLLLTDVPTAIMETVDREIDGGDGLSVGDIRRSSSQILYIWVAD